MAIAVALRSESCLLVAELGKLSDLANPATAPRLIAGLLLLSCQKIDFSVVVVVVANHRSFRERASKITRPTFGRGGKLNSAFRLSLASPPTALRYHGFHFAAHKCAGDRLASVVFRWNFRYGKRRARVLFSLLGFSRLEMAVCVIVSRFPLGGLSF